ncbi:MAG: bifunctional UDP-N-acetylglucosamine pyrophosphorylase / glucosamine-phosphate N-acetyltransferase [Thermoanaerobacter sp.]|jgi:bifunctional UDP-N-acetylglucosamine pyrophosphorylase/glucosamine-1-phosphate N-acetyltransferase|uniref:bifunctional UDP-N-acetylglucosamine diphosphorylase/glucosamine-1-phosphate N-acetyltransferase GlmU n=1 Tax=Desulfofundulus thermocisternus TaxID=42471 RepID=UPI000481A1A4|nr:bifunctional UDP-N-acetylglucosamine diphosphorylase/glucosamine-1-phosphate N-acetyltransferase GlmU [Desulfofundulus thermocisternus]MDK2888207.1 bifunctional UDP-N-acetylglucosamine pyrophosphorylase / glucosamine-phosphate N-acetyltransferase [Thermoanaerobacter sp.]
MSLAAVILAAGKGTRMKSGLPKVMHRVCGRPMIEYVLDAVQGAGVEEIVVVVGFGGDLVARTVQDRARVVYQHQQLGTAHALLQAAPVLGNFPGAILVVCGDTPLVTSSTLARLAAAHAEMGARATILTAILEDPTGYGRVIRDGEGRVQRIVEQRDATPRELAVKEINTGIYCFSAPGLFDALSAIKSENAQGEYYLTDIIGQLVQQGEPVAALKVEDPREVEGINDRRQLARMEAYLRQQILEELMLSGVTVVDPATTFVDRNVKIGSDTVIYPFTIIEGNTVIGRNCVIGPGSRLIDVQTGEGVVIEHSVIRESKIGDKCTIGPFAYIRPGCVLAPEVKVGDFVELKKTVVGRGSKIPHLSYVGDATVGSGVNIGAGTITCNYDGEKKWPTVIGDGAFIGSNTNLVAPVEVGKGAFIGAGSTITRDVPPGALGIERGRQRNIENWLQKKPRR